MDSAQVTCTPRDGAETMEFAQPHAAPDFPEAFLVSDIIYNTACGTNDVTWEIVMKNGDKVILSQVISVTPAR